MFNVIICKVEMVALTGNRKPEVIILHHTHVDMRAVEQTQVWPYSIHAHRTRHILVILILAR